MKKKIFCTVTNDLSYDQRMARICTSLAAAGYEVVLVGRRQRGAIPLEQRAYGQKRLRLLTERGKLFYFEYNVRLFFYLLFRRMDCLCAIDLDTILPCYLLSRLKKVPRVYDAHELFCEMKEVVSRPVVHRVWKWVEKRSLPAFTEGYTVNGLIAAEFEKMYGVRYEVIRNVPVLQEEAPVYKEVPEAERFILYQGAVNEGRCFESLIPAMRAVDLRLVICGEGNFMQQARDLVHQYGLEGKVVFKGRVRPEALRSLTKAAWCGITLFDDRGLSNYYSLANRFFDYMHAGIPQLAMDYPAYKEINNLYPIAVLVSEPGIDQVAAALNSLLEDKALYKTLQGNCQEAKKHFSWQEEEKKLIRLYQKILN